MASKTGPTPDTGRAASAPLIATFPEFLRSRKQLAELASQPLIRAIGRFAKTVVDATAGAGQDSYLLAVHGYSVIACERNREIALLFRQGLDRALADPGTTELIKGSIEFLNVDSIRFLPDLDRKPDAIYMDPMYPPKRRKSALARKEIQYLRDRVGEDEDAETLFDVAMQAAGERVVVKRPHYAGPIAGRPAMSYQGKLVRFDVYKVR
jgi:16S rRNA (guanine1516-N2)-methyltransferase